MNYQILPANKIKENYQKHLSSIRSGRVNASVLEHILVDAYGTKMHIHELSTINLPEPSQILITPFDKGVLQSMEKAIVDANIGVSPVNDGAGLRLSFPPLTEEARKIRVKEVYALLEDAKISVRNNRQDLLKAQKALKESGEISEDQLKGFESDIQEEVKALNKDLEDLAKSKEEEILKF